MVPGHQNDNLNKLESYFCLDSQSFLFDFNQPNKTIFRIQVNFDKKEYTFEYPIAHI